MSAEALINQTVIDDLFGGAMPKQEIQADAFIKVCLPAACSRPSPPPPAAARRRPPP
jgi:hypothetical protein